MQFISVWHGLSHVKTEDLTKDHYFINN